MNSFTDLGIKSRNLSGEKITMAEILDREIAVYDFRVEDSKYGKKDAKCLYLQVQVDGNMRIVFTGSTVLIDILKQIPESAFPFKTTIVKEMDWYKFT